MAVDRGDDRHFRACTNRSNIRRRELQRSAREGQTGRDRGRLERAEQLFLEHDRQDEIAIAVVVEQDSDLVFVVALDRALAPGLARHPCSDRKWLVTPYGPAP